MKIVVVGNASSLLNSHQGKLIDSCDVVIRLNKFKCNGFEDDVGTKTNIYCAKWADVPFNLQVLSEINTLWLPYPQPPAWWNINGIFKEMSQQQHDSFIQCHNLMNKHIVYLQLHYMLDLEHAINFIHHPSTGCIALAMAAQQYPNAEIFYTGFEALQHGWYWDVSYDCLRRKQHSPVFEKILLNNLKKMYNIHQLK